jgi:ATP-binding cassette, subfamily C (CFTR/MRP), member 1
VALQAALQIEYLGSIFVSDFRFWSTILIIISAAVILYVQYIEHYRSRVPSGAVLFYWLFLIIALTIKFRSLLARDVQHEHLAYFVSFTVGFGLACIEFILEYLIPKKQNAYDALGDEFECPFEYADIFSKLTFAWITPLMKLGYRHFLTQDDLWNLRTRDTAKVTGTQFNDAWEKELKRKHPRLWMALAKAYGWPYFMGAFVKLPSDVLQFIQPQFLRMLIKFVASYHTETIGNGQPQPVVRGCAISLTMFAISIVQTISLHQYFARAFDTGMRVRSGLTGAIFTKSIRLSNEGRSGRPTGDIVNYMAVDAQRLQDLMQFLLQAWSAPLQIVVCMISLYDVVGLSMFAGVAIMIIMIPINGVISKFMKTLQKKQMKNKDMRTRLMTEILTNMKSIKLYAWTSAFVNKLNHVRNDLELATLRKIGATQAFANFTWSTTPFFVSCATFAIFVVTQKQPLTADLVFPALALFNLLTFPLQVLPMVITSIVEALVAVERITGFLAAEELQPDAVRIEDAVTENGEESVRIRDGTFTWSKDEPRYALEDINFSARKGELSCIVGRVGAGKSSFLQALLGDLRKIRGEVVVRGKIAYVAQSSWIMNATVKDNITFGHRFDPQFYEQTIKACALVDDLAALPDGDETQVGERGISLSGGQKARVSLARAVYARADVYLLDDVLSAVDQHVGRHIIDNVLGSDGLLSGKTRVLATNSIPILKEAEFVVLIRNGKILEKGTYDQLLAMRGEVATILKAAENVEDSPSNSPLSASTASEETVYVEDSDEEALDGEADTQGDTVAVLEPIRSMTSTMQPRRVSTSTLRRASTASHHGSRGGKVTDEEAVAPRTSQTKERSEQGKVKWSVYAAYASSANGVAVAIYLFVLVAAQLGQFGSSVWLKHWSDVNGEKGGNYQVGRFVGIYFALGIASSALVLVQTMLLWIFCSIEASRKLHERMAYAIFRAPMSFFETTPTGRILNRFSSDIYRVDEVIARNFNGLLNNTARAAFSLAAICVATPWFTALILPLAGLYYYIQRYYLRTSRELKRLDSVSKSPIYAHFQESLNGISTVRAYRQQGRFKQENEYRIDANMRAYYPSISSNRWLAIRLEFIGSIIILFASLFAVVAVSKGGGPSASWLGLAMSYALQITGSLNWIVRQTVEVETNIVSVERVLEYAQLAPEAPEIISKNRPPISWPSQGGVTFDHYSTRYRPELDLVLKDISLRIKPKEKIGVVGRTGAGKSSLTLALFRIIEASDGNILIDDINTSKIGLRDLRGRLAIIPQDAALFEGTVRDNLDPGHVHDDTDLWSALGMHTNRLRIQLIEYRICSSQRSRLHHGRQARGPDSRRRIQLVSRPASTRFSCSSSFGTLKHLGP